MPPPTNPTPSPSSPAPKKSLISLLQKTTSRRRSVDPSPALSTPSPFLPSSTTTPTQKRDLIAAAMLASLSSTPSPRSSSKPIPKPISSTPRRTSTHQPRPKSGLWSTPAHPYNPGLGLSLSRLSEEGLFSSSSEEGGLDWAATGEREKRRVEEEEREREERGRRGEEMRRCQPGIWVIPPEGDLTSPFQLHSSLLPSSPSPAPTPTPTSITTASSTDAPSKDSEDSIVTSSSSSSSSWGVGNERSSNPTKGKKGKRGRKEGELERDYTFPVSVSASTTSSTETASYGSSTSSSNASLIEDEPKNPPAAATPGRSIFSPLLDAESPPQPVEEETEVGSLPSLPSDLAERLGTILLPPRDAVEEADPGVMGSDSATTLASEARTSTETQTPSITISDSQTSSREIHPHAPLRPSVQSRTIGDVIRSLKSDPQPQVLQENSRTSFINITPRRPTISTPTSVAGRRLSNASISSGGSGGRRASAVVLADPINQHFSRPTPTFSRSKASSTAGVGRRGVVMPLRKEELAKVGRRSLEREQMGGEAGREWEREEERQQWERVVKNAEAIQRAPKPITTTARSTPPKMKVVPPPILTSSDLIEFPSSDPPSAPLSAPAVDEVRKGRRKSLKGMFGLSLNSTATPPVGLGMGKERHSKVVGRAFPDTGREVVPPVPALPRPRRMVTDPVVRRVERGMEVEVEQEEELVTPPPSATSSKKAKESRRLSLKRSLPSMKKQTWKDTTQEPLPTTSSFGKTLGKRFSLSALSEAFRRRPVVVEVPPMPGHASGGVREGSSEESLATRTTGTLETSGSGTTTTTTAATTAEDDGQEKRSEESSCEMVGYVVGDIGLPEDNDHMRDPMSSPNAKKVVVDGAERLPEDLVIDLNGEGKVTPGTSSGSSLGSGSAGGGTESEGEVRRVTYRPQSVGTQGFETSAPMSASSTESGQSIGYSSTEDSSDADGYPITPQTGSSGEFGNQRTETPRDVTPKSTTPRRLSIGNGPSAGYYALQRMISDHIQHLRSPEQQERKTQDDIQRDLSKWDSLSQQVRLASMQFDTFHFDLDRLCEKVGEEMKSEGMASERSMEDLSEIATSILKNPPT